LGELHCSFEEYEKMTWAEFQLRLFSFNRVEKSNWFKIGEIVSNVVQAGFIDAKDKKKMLQNIQKAYQGKKKSTLTDSQRAAILKAQNKWQMQN
jgi:hypothetical protein